MGRYYKDFPVGLMGYDVRCVGEPPAYIRSDMVGTQMYGSYMEELSLHAAAVFSVHAL